MWINKLIKFLSDPDDIERQTPSENAELAEYQAAQDFALHADAIGWQISSILISAVLVAYGFVISRKLENIYYIFGIILLINIVLSIWILIFLGQNQVKLMKLFRVREIEKKYNLKQNDFWELERNGGKQGIYRTYGLSGVYLTKILFCVLVIFPVVYGMFELVYLENSNQLFFVNLILLILSILIPTVAIIYGCCQERQLKQYINYLKNKKP